MTPRFNNALRVVNSVVLYRTDYSINLCTGKRALQHSYISAVTIYNQATLDTNQLMQVVVIVHVRGTR